MSQAKKQSSIKLDACSICRTSVCGDGQYTIHSGARDNDSFVVSSIQLSFSAYYEYQTSSTKLKGYICRLPDTQEIILASSAKGGPPAGFAYHPGNIPMNMQVCYSQICFMWKTLVADTALDQPGISCRQGYQGWRVDYG